MELGDAGVGGLLNGAGGLVVILFLYEQTGWKPRTWEKSEGAGSGHD